MEKETAEGSASAERRCARCNMPLDLSEESICNKCADEMWLEKRRRNLFLHFFFQLGMLIFVYLYFYKGVFVLYRYFRG
jgi:predicted nucleic acid-binding Zn ribbon protein